MTPTLRGLLFVLFALTVGLIGYLYFNEAGPFDRSNRYFLLVPKAYGLKIKAPVRSRGVSIGKVVRIRQVPQGQLIELAVDKGVGLSRADSFSIVMGNLFGGWELNLISSQGAGEILFPGDTLVFDLQRPASPPERPR